MVLMKDGSNVEDARLGRLQQFDERSRNFRTVDLLTSEQQREPKSWTWNPGRWLDQGRDGACVGFAFTHELVAPPRRVNRMLKDDRLHTFALEDVYWEAQKIDPWPGGAYPGADPVYEGTSMLAGAKILKDMGYIEEYRWAFGEEDLFYSVSWLGPAVIGVNWYEGMFEPNKNGYIEPTGRNMGGHAVVVFRVRVKNTRRDTEWYEIWNSWGKSWGNEGTAKISREHMSKLLDNNGEAVVPLVRSRERS